MTMLHCAAAALAVCLLAFVGSAAAADPSCAAGEQGPLAPGPLTFSLQIKLWCNWLLRGWGMLLQLISCS